MKNISAIILCAVLLFTVLAGCGEFVDPALNTETPAPEDTAPEDTAPPESSAPAVPGGDNGNSPSTDYEAAFATFAPDTVMVTADEYTVTWAELFSSLRSVLNSLISNYGGIPDLSQDTGDGRSYAEVVINYAVDNMILYKAAEYGAKISGVTLSEDDLSILQDDYEMIIEANGSIEDFLKVLWDENGIYSYDLFCYLYRIPYLADIIFEKLYGVDGCLLSDESAAAVTASDGYLMAKHILRLKTEEGDDTPFNEIEDIRQQLDSYTGDDFDSFFDFLMLAYSEDTDGMNKFPNGYLFQYGDMEPNFYNACLTIDIGEYSDIFETSYGYHILYKLPINYDTIPTYYYSQNDYRTLRSIAAQISFNNDIYTWKNLLVPEYTAEFNSLDITKLFN